MNRTPHARFYANRGFVGDNKSVSANPTPVRLRGSHRHLEALINRQKAEIKELEEEYAAFKNDWEQRLRQVKLNHKEEQRQYLKKAQSGDHYKSISSSLTNLADISSSATEVPTVAPSHGTRMNIGVGNTPIGGALPIDII